MWCLRNVTEPDYQLMHKTWPLSSKDIYADIRNRYRDLASDDILGDLMDKLEAGIVMFNTIRRETSGAKDVSRSGEAEGSCVAKLACKLGHWARDGSYNLPGPARRWLADSIDTLDSWVDVPPKFSHSFRDVFNDVDDASCDSTCFRCIAL